MQNFILRHFQNLKQHPKSWIRKTAGVLLIIGGILGFLPIIGYWMLPLGLALLAVDWPWARHLYRKLLSFWGQQVRGLRLKMRSVAQRRKDERIRDTHSDP